MKVLLFTDTFYDANGVSGFLQNMANEALNNEKDLQIITSTNKKYGKNVELANLHNFNPLFKINIPFYKELELALPSFYKIFTFVKKAAPHFIHISTPGPVGLFGLIIATKLNITTSSTYHTDFPQYVYQNTKMKFFEWVAAKYMKFFYSRVDYIFTRSNHYTHILKTQTLNNNKRILKIKPGIDLDKFKPRQIDIKLYNLQENSFNVLYVGRLSAEKNFHFLLKTWSLFFSKNIKNQHFINFIVVGEGKILKEAEKYKTKNIHFLGYKNKDELAHIYSICDLFVFASTTETLGQVVMEAQACAMPAIVASTGGHLEITGNGTRKLELNEHLWCDEIQHIFNDKNYRELQAKQNFEFMQRYSIQQSFSDFWHKLTLDDKSK
jgi:glycosyltransferase involved in cell wall biosynthesis